MDFHFAYGDVGFDIAVDITFFAVACAVALWPFAIVKIVRLLRAPRLF